MKAVIEILQEDIREVRQEIATLKQAQQDFSMGVYKDIHDIKATISSIKNISLGVLLAIVGGQVGLVEVVKAWLKGVT